MKTSVREQRLLVISDLHLGSRLVSAGRRFRRLLRFALDHGYSVCINGDGVDLAHLSPSRLTRELTECFGILRQFPGAGLRVYYTVGNHDIVLEHFLEDWGILHVVPFLNVDSGDWRVRIEHGHTYDWMFLRYPRFYTLITTIGRWWIAVDPALYQRLNRAVWRMKRFGGGLLSGRGPRRGGFEEIPGEHPSFRTAAEEISLRGFDAVVFGHTHRPGRVTLRTGAMYCNTGYWGFQPWCVTLNQGVMWCGPVDVLEQQEARQSPSAAATRGPEAVPAG